MRWIILFGQLLLTTCASMLYQHFLLMPCGCQKKKLELFTSGYPISYSIRLYNFYQRFNLIGCFWLGLPGLNLKNLGISQSLIGTSQPQDNLLGWFDLGTTVFPHYWHLSQSSQYLWHIARGLICKILASTCPPELLYKYDQLFTCCDVQWQWIPYVRDYILWWCLALT